MVSQLRGRDPSRDSLSRKLKLNGGRKKIRSDPGQLVSSVSGHLKTSQGIQGRVSSQPPTTYALLVHLFSLADLLRLATQVGELCQLVGFHGQE